MDEAKSHTILKIGLGLLACTMLLISIGLYTISEITKSPIEFDETNLATAKERGTVAAAESNILQFDEEIAPSFSLGAFASAVESPYPPFSSDNRVFMIIETEDAKYVGSVLVGGTIEIFHRLPGKAEYISVFSNQSVLYVLPERSGAEIFVKSKGFSPEKLATLSNDDEVVDVRLSTDDNSIYVASKDEDSNLTVVAVVSKDSVLDIYESNEASTTLSTEITSVRDEVIQIKRSTSDCEELDLFSRKLESIPCAYITQNTEGINFESNGPTLTVHDVAGNRSENFTILGQTDQILNPYYDNGVIFFIGRTRSVVSNVTISKYDATDRSLETLSTVDNSVIDYFVLGDDVYIVNTKTSGENGLFVKDSTLTSFPDSYSESSLDTYTEIPIPLSNIQNIVVVKPEYLL